MATRLAHHGGPNPHTSGIFADMTVDGPEIGTLVVIVDRAKNLPNRKTMGKQNPYAAARLGKEAKKTETDKRGGQTPKWDQELRFTVHDSLDYHTLKISIFSEDKKATDLIGEALVNLDEILVPGGGKSDLWQGLNCKGRYAGELRVELTYYDTRPKPEAAESVAGSEEMRQSAGSGNNRVKRRPLPSNPNSRHVTPDTIPGPANPGRAKHGPRDFHSLPRAQSMPPDPHSYPYSPHMYADPSAQAHANEGPAAAPMHHAPPPQQHHYPPHETYGEPQQFDDDMQSQPPDFLPQLPPSNRARGSSPRYGAPRPGQHPPHPRPQSLATLPHSQSAPIVPQAHAEPQSFDDSYHMRTDYPEPIPDLDYQHQHVRQRRHDMPPGWHDEYAGAYSDKQAYVEDEDASAPPPPPMHSNSAPVVPHFANGHHQMESPASSYGSSPAGLRHNSVPNSSPLQNIERSYGQMQQTPPHRHPHRGGSMDSYVAQHDQSLYGASPGGQMPEHRPNPYARKPSAPAPMPHRNSVANPYSTTPTRPTPLSQEVSRPRSPQPPHNPYARSPQSYGNSPYQHAPPDQGETQIYRPRAISPRDAARAGGHPDTEPRPKSSYSIQHPVRAFESADGSPLSTSQPTGRTPMPQRKSVAAATAAQTPYSPDDFGIHNPNARPLPTANSASPHSPYAIRPSSGADAQQQEPQNGPIVGWNGQEIDPSDHLPVGSWAPEPEKKTPEKTYGLGRSRDFGPRGVPGNASGGRNLSKDTIVNFRSKTSPNPSPWSAPQQEQQDASPMGRNKLQKKSAGRSPGIEPLREHHNYNNVSVPNPYEQGHGYSGGFYGGGGNGGDGGRSPVYGGGPGGGYAASTPSLPMLPPTDALTREISSIDIGSGRGGRDARDGRGGVAFVPVRSHRDRNTYY